MNSFEVGFVSFVYAYTSINCSLSLLILFLYYTQMWTLCSTLHKSINHTKDFGNFKICPYFYAYFTISPFFLSLIVTYSDHFFLSFVIIHTHFNFVTGNTVLKISNLTD